MNIFRIVSAIYRDLRKALRSKFMREALFRAYTKRIALAMFWFCLGYGITLFLLGSDKSALFFAIGAVLGVFLERMKGGEYL